MTLRHEWKHEINYMDMLVVRSNLRVTMKPDKHAIGSSYKIRSIYFDTPTDKALREKLDGVNYREKFRIRFYNGDTSVIFLEKKSKINELCRKDSCRITRDEAQKIGDGDIGWMIDCDRPLCRELYTKMRNEQLKPKTIVDYTREPFVYPAGDVRVTLDYDIRTGDFRTDFLDENTLTMPAGDPHIILEVKWSEFLPSFVAEAVSLKSRQSSPFSKYAQCRIYG